jgi:ComF family protein
VSLFSRLNSAARQLWPLHECVLCAGNLRAGTARNSANTTVEVDGICAPCLAELPHQSNLRCQQCAVRLTSHDQSLCGQCLRKPPAFDRTIAAFDYAFPIDQLIQKLKYGHDLSLRAALSKSFVRRYHETSNSPRPDVLLVTPVSKARLAERGFNQSTELAKPIAQALALPFAPLTLARIKETPPQAQLPWKDRHKSIRGAFMVSAPQAVQGKRVAVLDDVLTTGATLNEIASVLKAAGAIHVETWVIARTQPNATAK